MSEEEQLSEKRWRKAGMSGSLRGRKSEEMTQSNTFSPPGRNHLLSPRWVMAIEVRRNKKIFGGGKNGGKKELVLLSVGEDRIGGT